MPPKKGFVGKNTFFGGNLPHLPDPYDYGKEQERKAFKEAQEKLQEKPFSQRVRSMPQFATIKEVYGENPPIPPRAPPAKPQPPYYQEVPFKPSKPPRSGYNCSLAKFPEYKPNPEKQVVRIRKSEDEPTVPAFKNTYKRRSIPSVSVALNIRNLKASYPSAFRR